MACSHDLINLGDSVICLPESTFEYCTYFLSYSSGTCGGKMLLLQFLDITDALMCLWKLRQIKLQANMKMPPLTFR
jgi:hypothetical protein